MTLHSNCNARHLQSAWANTASSILLAEDNAISSPAPGKHTTEIHKTGRTELHSGTRPRGSDTALTLFCLHLFYLPAFVSAFNIIATIFEKDPYGFCTRDSAGVTHTRDSRLECEHGACTHTRFPRRDAGSGCCTRALQPTTTILIIAKYSEGWSTLQAFQLVNQMLKMSKRRGKKNNCRKTHINIAGSGECHL